jgi:hypothetical protein
MSNTPLETPQNAAPPRTDELAEDTRVATGDRREEVRYESDPDQLVKARHLVRPTGQLPPDEHCPAQERGESPGREVLDVLVAHDSPSVWDARPAEPDQSR